MFQDSLKKSYRKLKCLKICCFDKTIFFIVFLKCIPTDEKKNDEKFFKNYKSNSDFKLKIFIESIYATNFIRLSCLILYKY